MIRTLAVGADPREELKSRQRFLREVEIPLLQAKRAESGQVGTAVLQVYSEREVKDIGTLLSVLNHPFEKLDSDDVVRLNDCVTLQDSEEAAEEEMVVHDARLVIRAPGFISADSNLGAAVLGRRVGDLVQVITRSGTQNYQLRGVRRAPA
jgi:transcription elongation GreA/GreB family factor